MPPGARHSNPLRIDDPLRPEAQQLARGHAERLPRRAHRFNHSRRVIGRKEGVGVEQEHELAASHGDGLVDRAGEAAVGVVDDLRAVGEAVAHQGRRVIGRGVVEVDQLQRHALRAERVQAAGEKRGAVPGDEDGGEAQLHPRSALPSTRA
jgi:hypothetical protein